MKIAYLFDSSSNYQLTQPDCFFVPMVIIVNENNEEKSYLDNELQFSDVEKFIKNEAKLSTSQPPIGHILETVSKIYEHYDMIIAIPFAKSLSSTFNSIANLQREYGEDKFLVADINTMGITGNWFLSKLQDYLKTHVTITQKELNKLCNEFKYNVCGGLILTDTKYLIAGGRLKGFKGLVAKTLKLKLVISFKDKLDFKDKSLHFKEAISKCLDIIDQDCEFTKYGIKNYAISINLLDPISNEKCLNYLQDRLNISLDNHQSQLPKSVVCHTGVNTISILIESHRPTNI